MPTPSDNFSALKQSMRSMWMAGDFGVVAETVAASAHAFVARLPLSPGLSALDVAMAAWAAASPRFRPRSSP